jgi:hypothetical protein
MVRYGIAVAPQGSGRKVRPLFIFLIFHHLFSPPKSPTGGLLPLPSPQGEAREVSLRGA